MKKTWLWYLYDFANSFASIVLIFYYPLILSEKGASNAWIGVSASVATGILLLVLPYLGSLSDKIGKRILFIRIGSLIMAFSLIIMSFIIKNNQSFNLVILFSLSSFYILFQVCFQSSFNIYTAMLRQISNQDNNVKISGIGFGLGQFGNALAIGIIGSIIGTGIYVFGLNDKTLAIFLGAILFLLISSFFFIQKEPERESGVVNFSFSYKKFLIKIFKNKKVFFYLIGYSLLADALLTFQLYTALYVNRVFNFSDKAVMYVAVIGLIFSAIGSFLANKFVRKIKDKNKTLRIAGISYGVCFGLCALMPVSPIIVYLVLSLTGFFYGTLFSLFRVIYSEISPVDSQGEFFSLFTVFERAASVVGPLVWLGTFYLLKGFGESIQYRGSIVFLMLICFIGIFFLRKSEQQQKLDSANPLFVAPQ